jgi:heme oxygenase
VKGAQPDIRLKCDAAPSFRLWLRDTTHAEHVLLDQSMSLLDLSTAHGYSLFLQTHVAAMQRLRLSYRPQDRRDFANLIRRARRDLGSFSGCRMAEPRGMAGPHDEALALGIGYVIRGSRLGAQVLRKRASSEFPTSFLDYATGIPWPHFVTQLDEFGARTDAASRDRVLAGAKLAFEIYAQACRGALGEVLPGSSVRSGSVQEVIL